MSIYDRPLFGRDTEHLSIIFDIVTDYMSVQTITPLDAARSITSFLERVMDTPLNVESVYGLWGTVFWLAKTANPVSPDQRRLFELLMAIRDVPELTAEGAALDWASFSYERFWTDLPGWDATWTTFERDAPIEPRMDNRVGVGGTKERPERPNLKIWRTENAMSGSEWRNLNSLLAKVHQATPIIRADLRGLFALIEALEEDSCAKVLDDVVPAAASWIMDAGEKILHNNIPYPTDADDYGTKKRMPWSRGALYTGVKCFSNERWGFWKRRFGELSERDDLDEATRICAAEARDEMTRIEEVSPRVRSIVIDYA